MDRSVRTLAFVLVALTASVEGAQAQNVAETLKRWGLLGTWSVDCSQPISSNNGYLTYVIRRAGHVSHERDFGKQKDVNEVQQARVGLGGALEVVVNFPGMSQTRRFTLVMGVDGRIRATANSKIDGSGQTIRDGKFTSNGADSPWQSRCR